MSSLVAPYTLSSRSGFVTTDCVTGTAAISFQPSRKNRGIGCGARRAGGSFCWAKAVIEMNKVSAACMQIRGFIENHRSFCVLAPYTLPPPAVNGELVAQNPELPFCRATG